MKAASRKFLSKFIGCCFFIVFTMSCGLFSYETKTIETIRGRLKYVQILEYRTAGTHGGKGWVSVGKQFYINEKNGFCRIVLMAVSQIRMSQ
jgi:hypothetical protein